MGASSRSYTFAYYCSGHGYGHATRVVALTQELLLRNHNVYICTNAPEHVFSAALSGGASYRNADIDAGIVQPKAYDVARRDTVDGLKRFLSKREEKLGKEVEWLKRIKADAVLVDAPFLPCAAAEMAGICSVIISNFTFDSCYSYLSVSTDVEQPTISTSSTSALPVLPPASSNGIPGNGLLSPHSPSSPQSYVDQPEPPIPAAILKPLVDQAIADYSNASLLLRLPGCIPLPSFDLDVPLPADRWTDLASHSFKPEIMNLLARHTDDVPCCSASGSQPNGQISGTRKCKRKVVNVPLIARTLAKDVYTDKARSRILAGVGVPSHLHHAEETKILVVSFGGQSIPRPRSAPPSPAHSLVRSPNSDMARTESTDSQTSRASSQTSASSPTETVQWAKSYQSTGSLSVPLVNGQSGTDQTRPQAPRLQRLMTQNHLYLPGAPPALHQPVPSPNASLLTRQLEKLKTEAIDVFQRTESALSPEGTGSSDSSQEIELPEEEQDGLLPEGWLAIVCGLSGKEKDDTLPDGFYAAPRDVYMPDLTAVCDVLLGKLGYGTCSETVATQTPFLYVPRPLFVEEFGLKRLMENQGTALPMSRSDFEAGRWSRLIGQAYEQGKEKKLRHREECLMKMQQGIVDQRASTVIAEEVERFMQDA